MATAIPTNGAAFTIREIVEATGGRLLSHGEDLDASIRGVSTDTRTIAPGSLFVALEGARFDGHAFVSQALRRGSRALLVSREIEAPRDVTVIRVADTLHALGALARAHRRRWAAVSDETRSAPRRRRVIGVGGSAGKTTTTRSISALLEVCAPGEVHAPHGNLNNEIGVPMTLLGLEDRHTIAVVEIGTNHRGEVARLAAITEPDDAVLTLIDLEHTEGIGTLDDVMLEEGDLVAAVARDGVSFGNADDARVLQQLERSPGRATLTVGVGEASNVRIVSRRTMGLTSEIVVQFDAENSVMPFAGRRELHLDAVGEASARAATIAWAVASCVLQREVTPEEVSRGMRSVFAARDGRMNVTERSDGTVIIDDSYNANPVSVRSSMRAAHEIAVERPGARVMLVLGEMRELGEYSRDEHVRLGEDVASSGAAIVCAIGGDARWIHEACQRRGGVLSVFVDRSDEAVAWVIANVRARDVVLVKGSRGVATEAVAQALVAATELRSRS